MNLNNTWLKIKISKNTYWICTDGILDIKETQNVNYNGLHNGLHIDYTDILRIIYINGYDTNFRDVVISGEQRKRLYNILKEYIINIEETIL